MNVYFGGPWRTYEDEYGIYDIDTHLMYEYYIEPEPEPKKEFPEQLPLKSTHNKRDSIDDELFYRAAQKKLEYNVKKYLPKTHYLGYVIDIYSNGELNNYSILVDTRERFEIKKNDVFMFEDHPTLKFKILECTRQGFFNHLLDIKCLNLKDNIIKIKAGTRIYIEK
ncbi:MAG: hypothetical protein KA270_02785 [Saprospiraceae bacterium]|nr:hypothetical protein [Saprospiraceae bacterium]